MRLYESMFVINSSVADHNYDEVNAEIESIISKHGGKVVDSRKWDERRLAYEIDNARRGTYILVHFETPPDSIAEMRRDFTLSEKILRQLILLDTDGVPTGDERPGITTSLAEITRRSRSFGGRKDAEKTGEKSDAKPAGDEAAAQAQPPAATETTAEEAPAEAEPVEQQASAAEAEPVEEASAAEAEPVEEAPAAEAEPAEEEAPAAEEAPAQDDDQEKT